MRRWNGYDADVFVVGSGPNGLSAAIRMAMEGLGVVVFERSATPGGGMRTEELMRSGVRHDLCSAIHPMALASPFISSLDLSLEGLEWIQPELPLAHPLDGGRSVALHAGLEATASSLAADATSYRALYEPIIEGWDALTRDALGPLRVPKDPLRMMRFGWHALRPATMLAERFATEEARALFAGLAAHSTLPLECAGTSAIGLILGAAGHTVGWPFPKGGADAITKAMVARLESLGGKVVTSVEITDLPEMDASTVILLDLTPRQMLRLLGDRCPPGYRRKLERFRYGVGSFKIDYVLSEPVPWSSADCRRAGTLHLGGSFEDIADSERAANEGRFNGRPYVIAAQHTIFDRSRTTGGLETLWAYCHVPHGSAIQATNAIEDQIERFAPGFKDCILERRTMGPSELEQHNPNYIGGDINGGRQSLDQLFSRPAGAFQPYRTPVEGVYLCSSSTPPGGGVHGMCGYHAAELVLRREFGISSTS
jgi:phytoene dehydrogenase-like protein